MTDLTDRMRTCAAFILSTNDRCETDPASELVMLGATLDAAELLIEASNALEAIPPPLGEPMEIIEPVEPATEMKPIWVAPGGALPMIPHRPSPRACPKCDSRAAQRVRRVDNKLMLECPVCAAAWEWKR